MSVDERHGRRCGRVDDYLLDDVDVVVLPDVLLLALLLPMPLLLPPPLEPLGLAEVPRCVCVHSALSTAALDAAAAAPNKRTTIKINVTPFSSPSNRVFGTQPWTRHWHSSAAVDRAHPSAPKKRKQRVRRRRIASAASADLANRRRRPRPSEIGSAS